MTDASQTVKEATVRTILGEMGPLLDKVDTIARLMTDGHALFEGDLHALGTLMSRLEAVLEEAADNASLLLQQQQAHAQPATPARQTARPSPASTPRFPWKALFACSATSSALVLGAMLAFNAATVEQARIGRAVSKALPYLDPATRQKLDAALQKSTQ
ncbi:hypothetical protein Q4S45_13925 [Massilia sp. R2A-15]|uniref:hypothetical protein n=1 Tax=Massilia sp. R2A-15 TaxID=3064278 RepID=UPI002736A758|nr:hypothetical protein [Massilia sp. R2A-15]WLI87835.1 hypothetical protein Q4S45_13925 [Massilia sp. R2A-15]